MWSGGFTPYCLLVIFSNKRVRASEEQSMMEKRQAEIREVREREVEPQKKRATG